MAEILRIPTCRDAYHLELSLKMPLKDTQLPNQKFKLRPLVFVIVMLVLVLLAYFYGASPP